MMNSFFDSMEKIEKFAQIQRNLLELEPNTDDEKIQQLIDQIPRNLLEQKEDLMVICDLFAIYGRIGSKSKRRNIFKLFDGIMDSIQMYLSDESKFFWDICGGHFYLKLWMYEKGLISIETIILSSQQDKYENVIQYFLPEIIEKEPEIFDKEIKYHIKCPYTTDYIENIKKLRIKYYKWMCESGDFNDKLYSEIETDPLHYALVTDDVHSFQKILSNSNINVNTKIKESLIQNSHFYCNEETLLEFALEYHAINISKFLIMNNVELTLGLFCSALQSNDLDMVHFVESKMPDDFAEYTLSSAISSWNGDMTDYILNNYDKYDFLEKSDSVKENEEELFDIIKIVFQYANFDFLKNKLIPFFNQNPKFIDENIIKITKIAFSEPTGFFGKEFLKYPNFDINNFSNNQSIFGCAIEYENLNAIEFLLKNPKLDINANAKNQFSPIIFACGIHADMKIIKLICNHPNIDINSKARNYNIDSILISVISGNFYSVNYLIDKYSNLDVNMFSFIFYHAVKTKCFFILEIMLKYFLNRKKIDSFEQLLQSLNLTDTILNELNKTDLKRIYDETISNK